MEKSIQEQLKIISKSLGAMDSKHFCVNQSTLTTVLFASGLSSSTNLSGWRIKYLLTGNITFTPVLSNGEPLPTNVGTLTSSNYTFHVNNAVVSGGQINKDDFFPKLEYKNNTTAPIDFYFLNKSEYDIAKSVSVNRYCFSISYILVNNTYVNTNLEISLIPMLKIECQFNTGSIIQSYSPDSPTMLLAPPCPPVWKPGFKLPKKLPVI